MNRSERQLSAYRSCDRLGACTRACYIASGQSLEDFLASHDDVSLARWLRCDACDERVEERRPSRLRALLENLGYALVGSVLLWMLCVLAFW
jgi:hypothetical protein